MTKTKLETVYSVIVVRNVMLFSETLCCLVVSVHGLYISIKPNSVKTNDCLINKLSIYFPYSIVQ